MGHGPVKEDPAIESFNRMREEAYKNFRWTSRTARTSLLGFVIVPGTIYYLASKYQMKWDWIATRKDQPLTVTARTAESD